MPTKRKSALSRKPVLSIEDSLVRLIDLPPDERETVLRIFARALAAAERRALQAEFAAYDAAQAARATVPPNRHLTC